jgi:hypothetical protein
MVYVETLRRPRDIVLGVPAVVVKLDEIKKHPTPNGGSLGSWIDEDRSYLRVVV